jgi:hypothetical protein
MALSIKAMHFPFDAIEHFGPSFELDLEDYSVTAFDTPQNDHWDIKDFLGAGKNLAMKHISLLYKVSSLHSVQLNT